MVKVLNVKTGEIAEQQFTVDSEFKALIPPLSAEERQLLEASIIAEGCRDAIVVWQGHSVILDGHNRYDICTAHNVPLFVAYHDFETRDHVIVWIVQNQLARRNITQYAKDELVIQNLKPALERIGTQRMSEGGKGLSDSDKPSTKHNTQKELADMANTSTGGIAQSDFIAKHAPDRVKGKARSGDMSRDRAYRLTKALEQSPTEWQGRIVELCDDNDEKVRILNRLHKSAGQPDTNGTFDEVMRAGGFHYGKDMELWCDFAKASVEDIQRALKSVAEHHAREGAKVKQQERIEAADALPQLSDYIRGDCLDVLKTLPPKSVRLLLTDPPYGMDFQSNRRTVSPQAPKIEGDGDITGALDLLRAMLAAVDPAMQDECHLLVFTGWRYEPQFRDVLTAAGYSIDASLIWVKENHTSGDLTGFAPKHERILHARRGRLAISPRVPDVLMVAREGRTEHPTEKPVELLKTLIDCTTVEGEFVVDPFAGTGATVTAARALNRRVLGIEKDDNWHAEGALLLGAA